MNCEISQRLLDIPAMDIPKGTIAQVHAHRETCPACSRAWQMQRLLGATLKASSGPELPEAAADRLLARVFAAAARQRRNRLTVSVGLAAVLVLGLVSGLALIKSVIPMPDYAVRGGKLVLQSERPATVSVSFDAGSTLKDVRFTIDLPEGMQVAGQPGLRHLSWMGELRKGQNLLKLPVMAHAGTNGLLTADINQDGEHRTFSVPVFVEQPVPLGSRLWYEITHVFDWRS